MLHKPKSFIKKFKFTFSIIGLLAFVLVMVPNIIWMLAPPTNDPLANNNSAIHALDVIMTLFQYILVACLILLKNSDHDWRCKQNYTSKIAAFLFSAIVCLLTYFVLWICYYSNAISGFLIFGLAFFPSAFFILLTLWQKNYVATVPAIIFAIFHITLSCINLL